MGLRTGLLACTMLGAASVAHAERLPIRTYTHLDGLAHTRVTCAFSDSRGFIWFCTVDGLSRFDGQGFTTYGLRDGLATARLNDFIETADGTYWVATNGEGVYRFTPLTRGRLAARGAGDSGAPASRFSRIPVGDRPQTARVNVVREDRAGRIWAGTDGGLFCLDPGANPQVFRRVELGIPERPDPAVLVWAVAEDRNGTLWVGTSWGLVARLSGGRVIHQNIQPARGADHVRALLVDRDGGVWVGHSTGAVVFRPGPEPAPLSVAVRRPATALIPRLRRMRVSTEDTTWLTARDVLSPGVVRSFLQTSNGDVWIATHYGLTRFDGRSFRSFTEANGLARPRALAEDREGNLWIATLNGGVQRLAIDGFRTYAESDGLSDSVVRTITEDAAGHLYFISQNQHVHRFDGDRFISVRPNLWRDVTELEGVGWAIQDRSGEWWVPGAAGLYRFPRVSRLDDLARVRPRLYTARDGLAGEDVRSLFEDSRGDIWIGRRLATALVLTRWARSTDTFHRYGEADGLPPFSRVLSFAEDRAGNVWFGFQNGGIARHRRGRFDTFTSSHGAPAVDVAAMHVDRRGRLWIGGQKPPLSRIDEPDAEHPRFISYTPARPLSGDSVGCIVEDRDGRLYLCSVGGPLDLLDPDTGDVRRFTSANGLIGADLLSGHQDQRGNVWFGSYNGVLRLIPTADPATNTPAVKIGAVRVAGENYLTSDLGESSVPAFELGSRQNRIQIEFFALGLVQGTGVRYQYSLEGADNGWNPPTDRRDVDYGSLAPGRYRFLVRALGADGAVNTEPASVEFTILGPIWQRWWFQASLGATILLLALAAHRVRVARLLALERVRMRIAADLHDDIGGSLSRIAIQSEVARREAATLGEQPVGRLTEIAESARLVVDALGDVVWSVDPRRDDLASVLRRLRGYADDVITGSGVRWTFKASGDFERVGLTPQARRHLYLLFKEALTNIARHASATSAAMNVSLSGHALRVELTDDGRGFDPSEGADGEARGHGLSSMGLRAAQLKGRLAIESTPDAGTRLVFEMSLPGTWRRMSMLLRPRLRWRRMRSVS